MRLHLRSVDGILSNREVANGNSNNDRPNREETHPGYEHLTLEIMVERLDPERYFAYQWHPCAIDPGVDYSKEPTTLVEFRLEDAAGARIPLSRRAEAFRMNDNGWSEQLKNIERHVSQP
jgi:hypothetical protein